VKTLLSRKEQSTELPPLRATRTSLRPLLPRKTTPPSPPSSPPPPLTHQPPTAKTLERAEVKTLLSREEQRTELPRWLL